MLYVFIIIDSPDDKDEEDNNDTTNIHTKPMYLKDYERNRLLEKGVEAGLTDSEDDEEKDESITYVQEQLKLKERFIVSLKKYFCKCYFKFFVDLFLVLNLL